MVSCLSPKYVQESDQYPYSRVPPDHRGLPGVLRHDAPGGRLAVDHAVAVGRPQLPGLDGGPGSGLLPLLQHPRLHLH